MNRIRHIVSSARLIAAVRVAAIVAIAVAGWFTVRSYVQLLSQWRRAHQPAAVRQAAAADLSALPAVLPLAGQWSFAEHDWNVRSHVVNEHEIQPHFEALVATTASERTVGVDQLPDVTSKMLQLVELLRVEHKQRDGRQVYRLDRPNLKAQWITRAVGGRLKSVSLIAAVPHESGHWQLFELTPRQSGRNRGAVAHLLPLPAETLRTAGRFADDGQLLMELVVVDADADVLLSQWKSTGWSVRPTGIGGAGSFSYLCARDKEVVYAWSADPRGSLASVMLVRAPTTADTKAVNQ